MKILVIQLRQFGDVLMTTPLVRQLKGLYPQCEIHVLSEHLGIQVYEHNPYVSKRIVVNNKIGFFKLIKTYKNIYKEKYDIVIDAFSNPKSAQICFFSRAALRIGFSFPGRSYAYNFKPGFPASNNEYSAISKLRLIEHFGANLNDFHIEFFTDLNDELFAKKFSEKYFSNNKIIAINSVSRRQAKRVDENLYSQLANKFIAKGFKIFLLYGPGEKAMASAVYKNIEDKSSAIIDYEGLKISQLAAILKHIDFYVGNDGGIKHLAICAKIPTFTLFQNVNWANWTPPESTVHKAITICHEKKDFCIKCSMPQRCLKEINADTVCAIIENELKF